jgi:hypothetical protein
MTRHSSKNRYLTSNLAQKAAAKYTKMYLFVHRWYECDECDYWHITTVRHHGVPVMSLDAITRNREEEK